MATDMCNSHRHLQSLPSRPGTVGRSGHSGHQSAETPSPANLVPVRFDHSFRRHLEVPSILRHVIKDKLDGPLLICYSTVWSALIRSENLFKDSFLVGFGMSIRLEVVRIVCPNSEQRRQRDNVREVPCYPAYGGC